MRFLEELNRPRTVLLVLGIIVVVNGLIFLLYNYPATFSYFEGVAPSSGQASDTAEEASNPRIDEDDYLTKVGEIQDGSVETFADSNDKLRRYDAITPKDVADLRDNYSALGEYRAQIENIDPPEGYKDQYELFSDAISELYSASEIAHRLAADPVSATKADFEAYGRHVDSATASLEESNETLGENHKTTEGLPLPTRMT